MSPSPEKTGFERFVPGYKRKQERLREEAQARTERTERQKKATQSLKDGVESAISGAGSHPERFRGCLLSDQEHRTRRGKLLYTTRKITLTKELPNGDVLSVQKWGNPAPDGGILEHGMHYAAVLTQSPDVHPELSKEIQIGVVDTAETSRSDGQRELAEALPDLVAASQFVEQEQS